MFSSSNYELGGFEPDYPSTSLQDPVVVLSEASESKRPKCLPCMTNFRSFACRRSGLYRTNMAQTSLRTSTSKASSGTVQLRKRLLHANSPREINGTQLEFPPAARARTSHADIIPLVSTAASSNCIEGDACHNDHTAQEKSPTTALKSKRTKGRVKIKMQLVENRLRRQATFSKRKTNLLKKAYELYTLTGAEVMVVVASETAHVYTYATPRLQPMIADETGKSLIQTCLSMPRPSRDKSEPDVVDADVSTSASLSHDAIPKQQNSEIKSGADGCNKNIPISVRSVSVSKNQPATSTHRMRLMLPKKLKISPEAPVVKKR